MICRKECLTRTDLLKIKQEIEKDIRVTVKQLSDAVNRDLINHEELRKNIAALNDFINNGGASYEDIQNAVNEYLNNNEIETGATPEQAAQINANVQAIQNLVSRLENVTNRIAALEGSEPFDPNTLATVATSGSYNDLKDKPTIPTVPNKLPNPYALTINGTQYDGSKAVNMTIQGGSGSGGSSVAVDNTLTVSGAAADAAKVGELLNEQKEAIDALGKTGLTSAQINALNGMFKVATYIKSDVSAEYSAFKTAFGIEDSGEEPEEPDTPEVTLTSISASYSGGDVAVGTSLDDLTGIVVTATYSDGSTATVTDYTLSGNIAEGANTITVSYGGKTATFTVTGVTDSVEPSDEKWTYNIDDVVVVNGSVAQNISGEITANVGTAQVNRRKHVVVTEGKKQIIYTEVGSSLEGDINNYNERGYYPIPIPETATSVTYSVTPATFDLGICVYELNAAGDTYTQKLNPGWKTGGSNQAITAKANQYLTIAIKQGTGNFTSEVSALDILFE